MSPEKWTTAIVIMATMTNAVKAHSQGQPVYMAITVVNVIALANGLILEAVYCIVAENLPRFFIRRRNPDVELAVETFASFFESIFTPGLAVQTAEQGEGMNSLPKHSTVRLSLIR